MNFVPIEVVGVLITEMISCCHITSYRFASDTKNSRDARRIRHPLIKNRNLCSMLDGG